MPNIQSPTRLLVISLALGVAGDMLFYEKALGVSVPTFVLMVLGALFWVGQAGGVRPVWRNLWLVGPLLFLAVMAAVRADPFLTMLNVFACLGLLMLVAYSYAAGRVEELSLVGYPLALCMVWANSLFRAAPLVRAGADLAGMRRRRVRDLAPVFRGFVIALPVLVIFTGLLASADMVFASYVGYLLRLDFIFNLGELWLRLFLVLLAAWLLGGALMYALARRATPSGEPWDEALDEIPRTFFIGSIEAATVLALVDLLFLAFGWVQLAYLFGGTANITAAGYTYADYARRGFFELVAVSVMTMALVLCLKYLARRETPRQVRLFNGLSSVMVLLTLLLLSSALWRMGLYQSAYGFTHLRLYVQIFEVWLAAAFAWFVVSLWLWPRRFAVGAFVAFLGFLATLNLVNPDAYIAEQNLARYRATGKLDPYYLAGLSSDGVPALVRAFGELRGKERDVVRQSLNRHLARLEGSAAAGRQMGPSFHASRWEAYQALDGVREQLR